MLDRESRHFLALTENSESHMLTLAGFLAFGLPFALPSISTPVGMLAWTVITIVGISVLVALLHVLYFILCGVVFVHLWIKGMIEERDKRENH